MDDFNYYIYWSHYPLHDFQGTITSPRFATTLWNDLIFFWISEAATSWIRAFFFASSFRFFIRAFCSSNILHMGTYFLIGMCWSIGGWPFLCVFLSCMVNFRFVFSLHGWFLNRFPIFSGLDGPFFTCRIYAKGIVSVTNQWLRHRSLSKLVNDAERRITFRTPESQ